MKRKSIFSQISTKPSPDSMKWAGKERSILASILLWGLWACRVASLLQIAKLIFRKTVLFFKRATTDKKATRVNVPPMFCEIYYLLWFGLFVTLHLLEIRGNVFNVLIVYYLFESVVWVLYYTVFRRFYEENYSIYHELEYLTVLILIIPTQALGLATLYGETFRNMISGLLGAGGDDTPFTVKVLGALFGAIVISMIISAFPSERVKKAYNKSRALVIGGGDVVANRLYPALRQAERPLARIEVLDLESHPEKQPYARYFPDEKALSAHLHECLDDNAMAWIETPTTTHVPYLRALLKSPVRLIVMEKPIARSREELELVQRVIADEEERERIFFLSYYLLEKALPLNMLCSYNAGYEKYLDVEDEYLAKNWRMVIGTLLRAEVVIHEGQDARRWIDADGGQLYETFLHNVLIASLLVGRPCRWEDVQLSQTKDAQVESIELSATSLGASIRLSQKKGVADGEKRRYARFVFSDGEVEADLEEQRATVRLDKLGRTLHVGVKDFYRGKYVVMTDLALRCYHGECSPRDVDGLTNQLEVLDWFSTL